MNSTRQNKPGKKSNGFFGCLLGFIILFGALYVIPKISIEGWDLLEAPWAHSITGRPTLTGRWVGEFIAPGDVRFVLYLEIARARRDDGRYRTERALGAFMDGQAQWCDNSGRHVENVPISGTVPTFTGFNAAADDIHIALILSGQTVAGLWPDELDGQWNNDLLTLHPTLADWDGNNTVSTVDEPPEPLTVTMKKGDQAVYQEMCKTVSGSAP